jgi:hypothetical protein
MDGIRVPLAINLNDGKYNVGSAVIEPDGSVSALIPDYLPDKLKEIAYKAYQYSPNFANGQIERSVRLQSARYGLQIRAVEQHDLWDDRCRLRRAWYMFREQLADTPLLPSIAKDAYWSTYAGIAYDLYWPEDYTRSLRT